MTDRSTEDDSANEFLEGSEGRTAECANTGDTALKTIDLVLWAREVEGRAGEQEVGNLGGVYRTSSSSMCRTSGHF